MIGTSIYIDTYKQDQLTEFGSILTTLDSSVVLLSCNNNVINPPQMIETSIHTQSHTNIYKKSNSPNLPLF